MTVDIVTNRSANLHDDLVRLLDLPANFAWVPESGLSAIAYRVIREQGTERERLDVWPHPIALGAELPTVPLWLVPGLAVPLELELTYPTTCDSLKVRSPAPFASPPRFAVPERGTKTDQQVVGLASAGVCPPALPFAFDTSLRRRGSS